MSVPADLLQQILQGGLMNYSQPNALDKGLMSGDPSSQFYAQMAANSNTPGNFIGILGRSLLGTQEAQQKNAQQQLALMQQGIGTQQAVQMFPYLQQAMGQAFGQPGQQPGQAPSQGAPAPQGAQSAPGPAGGPQSMANLGAMLGLMGRPGGQQLIDAAKFQAENDPANATRLAAAKGEVAQDQLLIQQAAARGDIGGMGQLFQKYQQDIKALQISPHGMISRVDPMGGVSMTDVPAGIQYANGMQSPIPGAPQTAQQMTAARAMGEAAGKPFESTNDAGIKTVAPLSSVLGGGGQSVGGAPSRVSKLAAELPAQSAKPAASAKPSAKPQDPTLSKALADPDYRAPVLRPGQSAAPAMVEARNKLMQDSSDATTAAAQSLQYLKAAQSIMTSKGAPTTTLTGQIRAQVGSVFGTVNATNYQEVAKYLGNAALTGAKSIYGARMTASEVGLQLNELSPSVKMTDGAIKDLLGTNIRNAQYTVDTANRARLYVSRGNDPMSFGQWNQQYWPRAEIVNEAPAAGIPIGKPQTIGEFTVTRIK